MNQFADGQLRRAVGFDQSGVSDEWKVLAGFRMLDFVEQDRRHQHRVDPVMR